MRDIFSFFEKPKETEVFNALRIGIASPKVIRDRSHGEKCKDGNDDENHDIG